jgi:DNA modification methylase
MILLTDARVGLARLHDESVDCIVTDIPYKTISGGKGGEDGRPSGMLTSNDGRIFDHNDIDLSEYVNELFRVLKSPGQMWLFTNEKNRRRHEGLLLEAGFRVHGLHAWRKNNAVVSRWGMKNMEHVFLVRKGSARGLYTPGLKQSIDHDNIIGNKQHPTEKPVGLLRQYIEASSLPGDLVLDPFVGCGSTAVAARLTGRRFLGFEIDPVHFNTASRRLAVEVPQ